MNITNIIIDYVNTSDITGAILINGEWGVGKSFYWREKIVPILEKLTDKDGIPYKCLYVSLNGITETIDIMAQLNLEKNTGPKAGKIIHAKGIPLVKTIGQWFNKQQFAESVITAIFEATAPTCTHFLYLG